MNKHTPGPWVISNRASLDEFLIKKEDYLIASVWNGNGQHDVNTSNAQLIAAAPEMLRLLRQAYSLAGKYGHSILEGKIEKLINSIDHD
jgi:hypothetical protein